MRVLLLEVLQVLGQLTGGLLKITFLLLEWLRQSGGGVERQLVGLVAQLLLHGEQVFRALLLRLNVLEVLLQGFRPRRVFLLLLLFLGKLVDPVLEPFEHLDSFE